MNRCLYCYGVVTKEDAQCYTCGERVPKHARAAVASRPISALSNMLFLASLGLTAFSFLSPHKLPLSVTLAISGFLFAVSVADRFLGKNLGQRGKYFQRAASRLVRQ